MKAVILLAGKGRRLGERTKVRSKAFTQIGGAPVLGHLVDRLIRSGVKTLVPVLGHDAEGVLGFLMENYADKLSIEPVRNERYELTNNLSSLYVARDKVSGTPFIVCNGDLVINGGIISRVIEAATDSAIALDDRKNIAPIDSPCTIVRDGRIYDLGRHIPRESSGGYAIGVYKFGAVLAEAFFRTVEKMPEAERDNGGFHDPLCGLFDRYPVYGVSTQGMSCMDIDEPGDIPKAEALFQLILRQEQA